MLGTRIGLYRIEEKLAQGGTAAVYRCVQVGGGAELAVKFIARGAPDYPALRARLFHEATVCLRANHPCIVRCYTTGEIEEGCYAIQELLAGRPLHHVLREESRPGTGLPLPRALEIGADLAEALAHLHGLELVHADLKPPNVMLCCARAVICDLGLAVRQGEARAQGLVMGTPSYMAPELGSRVPIERCADLWSLGVVLFEMLVGVRPFGLRNDGPEAILKAVREAPLPPLLERQPQALRALVEALLTRDPSRRPAAAEAGRQLRGLGFLPGAPAGI